MNISDNFSFQLEHTETGCEDAPPVSSTAYTIICDGLGGSGSGKHLVGKDEEGNTVYQTSAYLGSRAVCDSVAEFYSRKAGELFSEIDSWNRIPYIEGFVKDLHSQIVDSLNAKVSDLGIEIPRGRTFKALPTTLASALYFPHDGRLMVLAIWAGDSRVYVLTPSKGLQLLSLDDAKTAEEMNSTGVMTNQISANNSFRLNYALYELSEPGIVFCCSDGCSDCASPLHFEFYLTLVIAEYMEEDTAFSVGKLFAEGLGGIYKKEDIGDDVSMAGVIFGMDSVEDMKEKFAERISEVDSKARCMNDFQKKLKALKDKDADKLYRIAKGKILPEIQEELLRSVRKGMPETFVDQYVISMPCYSAVPERIKEIEANTDKKIEDETKELKLKCNELWDKCHAMLVCDYIRYKMNKPANLFLNTFGDRSCSDVSDAVQVLQACMQMLDYPEFKQVAPLHIPTDDYEGYIKSIVNQIEVVLRIFEEHSQNQLFDDLWQQSYYSTRKFKSKRLECERDQTFEAALKDLSNCKFASELTKQKLQEYHRLCNNIAAIKARNSKQKQNEIELVKKEFWKNYENEILEQVLGENSDKLLQMFENTSVSLDRLRSYVDARARMKEYSSAIQDVQKAINAIWQEYKSSYLLNKRITEKGAV